LTCSLEFNEELHQYKLDGVVVPSVTQVIAAAGLQPDMSFVDPWYLARGTAVHRATELLDLGTLDWDTVDDEVEPYLAAYQQFLDDLGDDYQAGEPEQRVVNQAYRYAGTIDRAPIFRGHRAVLDIKTGAKLHCHALQLAAYQACVPEASLRLGLHLRKDRTYRLETYSSANDWPLFAAANNLWHWRAAHNLLPKEPTE